MINYQGKLTGVFHAVKHVYAQYGIYGLYRGHSAMLLRIFPYSGINYAAYEKYKKILMSNTYSESHYMRLLSGSLAGATAVFFTYPLDIMRARLAYITIQSQYETKPPTDGSRLFIQNVMFGASRGSATDNTRHGLISTLRALMYSDIRYNFMRNLYRGFVPTVLGIIPYAGISFFTFETMKGFYVKGHPNTNPGRDDHVPIIWKFLFGLMAGAFGQTVAYPLDIIRRRMQLHRLASHLPSCSPSMRSTFSHILRTLGWRGFFVGLSINYIKVAPSSAISFVTYEWIKEHILYT